MIQAATILGCNRLSAMSVTSGDDNLLRSSETESRVRGALSINAPFTGDRQINWSGS